MLETEFNEKYPDLKGCWDLYFDEDESYAGYPTIGINIGFTSTISFEVWADNIESCLDIADKTIQKLIELDFSENEEYLSRAHKAHKEFFEQRENYKKKVRKQ